MRAVGGGRLLGRRARLRQGFGQASRSQRRPRCPTPSRRASATPELKFGLRTVAERERGYHSRTRLSALTPGTRLGPYEILAAIGAGGMGEVYRARDTRLGRDVAVKIV